MLAAIKHLEVYYRIFQDVDVCESNHGLRVFKKAMVCGLPRLVLKRYEEILKYPPGWKYHEKGLEIDGVKYTHGTRYSQATWRRAHERERQSCVIGHLHSGPGVVYSKTNKFNHFSMQCGALINEKAYAMRYSNDLIERPVPGAGIIIDGEYAMFIHMESLCKL